MAHEFRLTRRGRERIAEKKDDTGVLLAAFESDTSLRDAKNMFNETKAVPGASPALASQHSRIASKFEDLMLDALNAGLLK